MTRGPATASPPPPNPDPFDGVTMVPALPCRDIAVTADFWNSLGVPTTFRQERPYPYVAVGRGLFNLHYYGLAGHDPEASHATCIVVVDDPGAVFDLLAAGLRASLGRLPLTGTPRITRPRARANAGGRAGFSVVDPDGGWIRFSRRPAIDEVVPDDDRDPGRSSLTPLARAVSDAVVTADSRGIPEQGRRTLAGALRRHAATATVADRAVALAYLAELAVRTEDREGASSHLDELERLDPDVSDPAVATALAQATELRALLGEAR